MRYFKMEGIHKRTRTRIENERQSHGVIHTPDLGGDQDQSIKAVESTYIAVNPTNPQVHHYVETVAHSPDTDVIDFNNTARYSKYKENDQLPLFHERTKPGSFEVLSAFGDERGRTHSMRLLATAKARAEKLVGPLDIKPSTDLSPHSFTLVKNLEKRGLVEPQNYGDERNTVDFWDSGRYEVVTNYAMRDPATNWKTHIRPEEITNEERNAGKEELRRFLGHPSQPKKQPPVNQEQFEQLKLDGF